MNIVITGAGEVGRHLAEHLSNQDHNISVIEADEQLARDLDEKLDSHVLCADGSTVTTLAEANVAECDLFLALTSDKNTNLVSASMAKSMGARKVIARVNAAVQREEWLFNFRQQFKIDYLFSVERLAAVELGKHIRNPNRLVVEEFARGRIELQQLAVGPGAPAVGKRLQELQLPDQVRVAFIERREMNVVPTARHSIENGDKITLFGEPNNLSKALPLFDPDSGNRRDTRVVIFGGGEYGFTLAQMLEAKSHFKVRIIEEDKDRCEELSELLQRTTIIHGDATSLQQLKEEQVGEADFFVATSREDEDNVMTCLQARNLGTEYCMALVHRADYADVISRNESRLGIHAAVSPRVSASRDLTRFITSDAYHHVMKLSDEADVLELVIPAGSKVNGRRLSEVQWPEGSGLVAILRGQQAIVPGGNDQLQIGDTVYVVATHKSRKPFLKLISSE